MDRDKRWDRVEQAYKSIIDGTGPKFNNPISYIKESYKKDVFDELIVPALSDDYDGVQDGDALLLINFRSDRVRQILSAFLQPDFEGFKRHKKIKWAATLGMKEYSDSLAQYIHPLFPFERPKNTLGEVVSSAGKAQLRAAETEKYAHVTFFFNGGYESKFAKEDRILVASPKVHTYDLKPEMSAFELTEQVQSAIESGQFDLIVVNYANPDMVGHTGNLAASVKAVEVIDECLLKLVNASLKNNGNFVITADHGNVEQLMDFDMDQPHTAHTTNFVPFLLITEDVTYLKDVGTLTDVAPTILNLMNIEKPIEMTGRSLIIEK
jgi:2,3-bisphosphoglycerate-independent phosphoglycerate mutase